jgi:hypothetical protein
VAGEGVAKFLDLPVLAPLAWWLDAIVKQGDVA